MRSPTNAEKEQSPAQNEYAYDDGCKLDLIYLVSMVVLLLEGLKELSYLLG